MHVCKNNKFIMENIGAHSVPLSLSFPMRIPRVPFRPSRSFGWRRALAIFGVNVCWKLPDLRLGVAGLLSTEPNAHHGPQPRRVDELLWMNSYYWENSSIWCSIHSIARLSLVEFLFLRVLVPTELIYLCTADIFLRCPGTARVFSNSIASRGPLGQHDLAHGERTDAARHGTVAAANCAEAPWEGEGGWTLRAGLGEKV